MDGGDTFNLTSLKTDTLPVTQQEERELRRVYDLLCDYQRKIPLRREIQQLVDWIEANSVRVQSASALVNADRVDSSVSATQARVDDLKRQIAEFESNASKKISCGDVHEILKTLKQKTTRKEVEEIVWECDEDLDLCLSWDEFKLMFTRNIMDKTGLQPSRMVRFHF